MQTKVVKEEPALVLEGRNGYSYEYEVTEVSWETLRNSAVGQKWMALDHSNCVRDSRNESATVVFKNDQGVAVLVRRWGTTDDQWPQNWETLELVWYEFR
jgi:hypothetical protein